MLMEAQKKADRSREEVLTKSKQVEKLQIIINNLQDKVHKITSPIDWIGKRLLNSVPLFLRLRKAALSTPMSRFRFPPRITRFHFKPRRGKNSTTLLAFLINPDKSLVCTHWFIVPPVIGQ